MIDEDNFWNRISKYDNFFKEDTKDEFIRTCPRLAKINNYILSYWKYSIPFKMSLIGHFIKHQLRK